MAFLIDYMAEKVLLYFLKSNKTILNLMLKVKMFNYQHESSYKHK